MYIEELVQLLFLNALATNNDNITIGKLLDDMTTYLVKNKYSQRPVVSFSKYTESTKKVF